MQICDGRSSFYQWDLNQKITAPEFDDGDEIHFVQGRSGEALVVKAYKRGLEVVADVPNILLQSPHQIRALRYVKDGESEYTVSEHTFGVMKRPKPEDYVYTETEILRVEDYVRKALKEAKESGEFKGDKGDPYVLTEKDKAEIKIYVDEAILGGEW